MDSSGAPEETSRQARDSGGTSGSPTVLRTDIQGLRAVAVSLVVVYHLFPSSLTGGFAGVDVFFVISGFLITLHLMQRPPSGARDLATFWGRRIRRLLPASLLVLTTTLVLSRLVAPDTQWDNTARQARGATLYVVNWLLARDSVDYLAAENAPSPVQHFWSLSVEEQFYFVWPILILALLVLARGRRWNRDLAVLAGLGVLVVASLGYSVWETSHNPAAAYFVTPTRMWELGVGALLAVVVAARQRRRLPFLLPPVTRSVLAWLGLAAIAWTTRAYTGSTPFPGWQALLPVLGTAVVIGAHSPMGAGSPGPLLALRPMQWLGDVSYSVYLWHWPLIVLVPQLFGHDDATNADRAVALVLTLVLAWLTKEYVEDRFRTPQWGTPLRKPFLLGAAGMAVVIALAGLQLLEVAHRQDEARAQLARAVAERGPCFGARALDDPERCEPVRYDQIVPAPADAANDKSRAYQDVPGGQDCFSDLPRFRSVRCTFGDRDSDVDVALVGNSHAGQWLPALERLAQANHWRITTYLASQCAAAAVRQAFATSAGADACEKWVERTTRDVARSRPAAVVYTNRISIGAEGRSFDDSGALYGQGMEDVLRSWHQAGLRVLVLRDTPAPDESIPDCLAQHPDDVGSCDGPRDEWLPEDQAEGAVQRLGASGVTFADLTEHICPTQECAAVIGGVVTYFDGSHLTATYASTLDRYLGAPLRRLVDGPR
jgi:peptidoglycan/LPS O-acetylase OafA/YrhL